MRREGFEILPELRGSDLDLARELLIRNAGVANHFDEALRILNV